MTQEATLYDKPRFAAVGDCALLIELGSGIDPFINELVLQLEAAIVAKNITGVEETTPAYNSLMLHYDPCVISFETLQQALRGLDLDTINSTSERFLWHVPVCYGGQHGADLETVASYHHLTTSEIIRLHSKGRYRVYMTGFAPGFTYLGGLEKALHTPRRPNPRLHTPAGSVSIGGMQALIAGVAMPSGWQLLGQTPLETYSAHRDPHFLISAGDAVQFHPINAKEFARLQKAGAKGKWLPEREPLDQTPEAQQ